MYVNHGESTIGGIQTPSLQTVSDYTTLDTDRLSSFLCRLGRVGCEHKLERAFRGCGSPGCGTQGNIERGNGKKSVETR